MALDPYALRQDFPLLAARDLAYLDSASTAQKPAVVLDALSEFYRYHYANVHRSVYGLAEEATERYEAARARVASFVGGAPEEVVFTRSTTGALNLVATALERGPGGGWGPKDVIVTTALEHHSNFVPWQQLARRKMAKLFVLPVDAEGELDLAALEGAARLGQVRLVTCSLVSNALGTVNPVAKLARFAHAQGALMVVDAAQAAPHRTLDVQALGADFLAFSAHKLGGPTGVGALWGRRELLDALPPYEFGGEMIRRVSVAESTWNTVPYKFEAGTPPVAEAFAFARALDYLAEVGLEEVEAHERRLVELALELLDAPDVTLHGPPPQRRSGIVSFSLKSVHPHDVAQILDYEGVCVRAGHHCAEPLMRSLRLDATTRASFWLYTTEEDVRRLARGLERVRRTFQ